MTSQLQETPPPRVVLAEAAELAAADTALKAAAERLRPLAWQAQPMEAYHLGRLAEALDQAAEGVFQALNIAQAYLDCSASKAAIRAQREQD